MRTRLVATTVPPPPLPIEEAAAYLRVVDADELAEVADLLAYVTAQAEELTRRAFVTRSYEWTVWGPVSAPYGHAGWLSPTYGYPLLAVPRTPVASVASVTVTDTDGAEEALAEEAAYGDGGWAVEGDALRLPRPLARGERVVVAFDAGYGEPGDLPDALRLDLLRALRAAYDHRDPVVVGTTAEPLPPPVMAPFLAYRRVTV